MKTTSEIKLQSEYTSNSKYLDELIKPLSTAKYECDIDFRHIKSALTRYEQDFGGLELNPDFQRGHVWNPDQQKHYLENVFRGVVSTSGIVVQFNCPNWDDVDYSGDLPKGFQCIDGLQRLTAVMDFLDGKVKPFGLLPSDLNVSRYSLKGCSYRFRLAVHTFSSRSELLQHYLDLNTGGTPHSKEEIERVNKLLEACHKSKEHARVSTS